METTNEITKSELVARLNETHITEAQIELKESATNTETAATQDPNNEVTITLLDKPEKQKNNGETSFRTRLVEAPSHAYTLLKPVEGYFFGILFAVSMCMMNVFVKMAPALDGSNVSLIRYIIQLIVCSVIIRWNKLDFLGPREQRWLLLLRGVVGAVAVIISFFAIRYLDLSDVETLANSTVIITAIIARFVLREKLTVTHIIALVLTIAGVLFIIRPSFLFGIEHDITNIFVKSDVHVHQEKNVTRHSNKSLRSLIDKEKAHIKDHSNREFIESVIGVVLILLSATCQSVAQVVIRKLCLVQVHFSVNSMYPALVGLPLSLILSGVFHQYKFIKIDTFETMDIVLQLVYSIFGGIMGTLGLIFLNLALKYEDATKIGMVKTNIGIFLAFILQYIVLDIRMDSLGLIGAVFVISATLSIMLLKIFDKSLVKSKNVYVRFFTQKF